MSETLTATAAERAATRPGTSLPLEITQGVRDGTFLVGDDFNGEQLDRWFAQEQEAFYQHDAGNSPTDPWYAYMRYVNDVLGFSRIPADGGRHSVLLLGPGSGVEIETFASSHPTWGVSFLEASANFRRELRAKWPEAVIVEPRVSGDIELPSGSQALVCAFSVLHHIPNVSKVVREIFRVTAAGGYFFVREPCSSMGDWRKPRSATPNERGIACHLFTRIAQEAGFELEGAPVPILFEPINRIVKRTIGFRALPFGVLYWCDRLISGLLRPNDHYWRDRWYRKLGPSSYFYVFRKQGAPHACRASEGDGNDG